MKIKQIFYLCALAALSTSCLPKNDPQPNLYSSSLGTVENYTNSTLFKLICDDETVLNIIKTNAPSSFIAKTGQRMAISYYLINEDDASKPEKNVHLVDGIIYPTRNLLPLTEAVADTVGNDPVRNVAMYIGSHFLNVQFEFGANNQQHSIEMVRDSLIAPASQDTVKLQFRHNSHNDWQTQYYRSIICFDIAEVQGFATSRDSVFVEVSVMEYGSTQPKKYNLVYKF
ncbi:MAG: NigD-like protein [Prevotellaceae bacterium]|jgi:hypothetical protein|nr:NigD-like protein [Prevotellaceae bacterium]